MSNQIHNSLKQRNKFWNKSKEAKDLYIEISKNKIEEDNKTMKRSPMYMDQQNQHYIAVYTQEHNSVNTITESYINANSH